jgi:hypothetical protein
MFCTKNTVCDVKSIPEEWIYLFYAGLNKKFDGENYLTISPILRDGGKREENASFSVYYKDGRYKWKDHGKGLGGSAIDLVKALHGVNFHQACSQIIADYNNFIMTEGSCKFEVPLKKELKLVTVDEKRRDWNSNDKGFWRPYYFGKAYLEESRIFPISEYTIKNGDKIVNIRGEFIYGFYTGQNELFKIYQPKVNGYKYITVKSHIANSEFCKNHPYYMIANGYKDCRAFELLGLKVDVQAGNSEGSMLPADVIERRKKKYKTCFTCFDPDPAGIAAAEKYKKRYGLEPVKMPERYDIAGLLKAKGPDEARKIMAILINKLVNEVVNES